MRNKTTQPKVDRHTRQFNPKLILYIIILYSFSAFLYWSDNIYRSFWFSL